MTKITTEPFGVTSDQRQVTRYVMTNAGGSKVSVLNYGGIVQRIQLHRNGNFTDVCLGFESVSEYEKDAAYLGALIGRYANRIGGGFQLGGKQYRLDCNDGKNLLHGGKTGFHRRFFDVEMADGALILRRVSPDGEEHFPGNLSVSVEFRWQDDNSLTLRYTAVSDADTVCNLTNHCYFNLSGAGSGTVLDQLLHIKANRFTEIDAALLPTGAMLPVAGTPFDFTAEKPIGQDLGADCEQLRLGGGYDHNFLVHETGELNIVATARSLKSDIALTILSTMPGIQFYSGNGLASRGIGGRYPKYGGFCLETQYYPDAPNHPGFPSANLPKGQRYHHTTVYRFD